MVVCEPSFIQNNTGIHFNKSTTLKQYITQRYLGYNNMMLERELRGGICRE